MFVYIYIFEAPGPSANDPQRQCPHCCKSFAESTAKLQPWLLQPWLLQSWLMEATGTTSEMPQAARGRLAAAWSGPEPCPGCLSGPVEQDHVNRKPSAIKTPAEPGVLKKELRLQPLTLRFQIPSDVTECMVDRGGGFYTPCFRGSQEPTT